MSGRIPIGRALLMTGIITSVGYGIMALTTPSDKQFYDSLSPDLKKKVDEVKSKQKYQEEQENRLKAIQSNADDEKPVWNSTPR